MPSDDRDYDAEDKSAEDVAYARLKALEDAIAAIRDVPEYSLEVRRLVIGGWSTEPIVIGEEFERAIRALIGRT